MDPGLSCSYVLVEQSILKLVLFCCCNILHSSGKTFRFLKHGIRDFLFSPRALMMSGTGVGCSVGIKGLLGACFVYRDTVMMKKVLGLFVPMKGTVKDTEYQDILDNCVLQIL